MQLSLVLLLGDVDIHAEAFTLHTRRFTKNIHKMRGKKQWYKTVLFSSAAPLPRIVKLLAHMLRIQTRMGRRPITLFARRYLRRLVLLPGAPQDALGRCV